KVVQPATPYDVKGLMITAIEDLNPVIVYEHKLLYDEKGSVPEEAYRIPLGKANVARVGRDVTIVATGILVQRALKAANFLAERGISVEVIDPRTLVPLDEKTILQSVQKTGCVLITHEAVQRAGYGAEIASIIAEKAFHYLKTPVKRLGGEQVPIPHNKQLERKAVPQVEDIVQTVESLVKEVVT